MIKAKPIALNAASPATIITTPMVIVAMMTISLMEGLSRPKTKAKRRTKARADDLHIVRKVRVMNFKDMLPRPISSDVATLHGTRRVT